MIERSTIGSLFQQFLFQHFFIALGALSLCLSSKLFFGINNLSSADLFIACSTMLMYNFHKLHVPQKNDLVKGIFSAFYNLDFSSKVCLIAPLIACMILGLQLSSKILVVIMILSLICFAYSMPVPFLKKRLRETWGIKIFSIAVIWSLSTVVIPLMHENIRIYDSNVFLLIIHRFLLITVLTIPFEIRDMEKEKRNNIILLPHTIGIKNFKLFGAVLTIFMVVTGVMLNNFLFSGFAIALYSLIFLIFAEEKRHGWYFKFFIDGAMILQLLFILLEKRWQ